MRGKDITGQKFGRLTVLSTDGKLEDQHAWKCSCECGGVITVRGSTLRNGDTRSCGCIHREKSSQRLQTHGLSKVHKRAYDVWFQMLRRCTNSESDQYKDYGGRGIAVSPRWHQFENFLADMGDPPKGFTLERKNNELGYSVENCKWATRTEQNRNQRSNRIIEFNGQAKLLCEWAEILQVDHRTLNTRIDRDGWTIERAFTTPVRTTRKKVTS